MSDHSDQLRQMRRAAGYRSARGAAIAMAVPVATYSQHESGARACTLAQFEHYGIFFQGVQLLTGFLQNHKPIPLPDELAPIVYDALHRARRWAQATAPTRQAYTEALEEVFRAFRITLPDDPEKPASGHPGAF